MVKNIHQIPDVFIESSFLIRREFLYWFFRLYDVEMI